MILVCCLHMPSRHALRTRALAARPVTVTRQSESRLCAVSRVMWGRRDPETGETVPVCAWRVCVLRRGRGVPWRVLTAISNATVFTQRTGNLAGFMF